MSLRGTKQSMFPKLSGTFCGSFRESHLGEILIYGRAQLRLFMTSLILVISSYSSPSLPYPYEYEHWSSYVDHVLEDAFYVEIHGKLRYLEDA